jgi:outer membrane receptor protein involved in Fe transport
MRTGSTCFFWVVVLGCLLAEPGYGQDEEELGEFDDFDELYLGELLNTVYSASKHRQDLLLSPATVSVIDREQIENSHCTDLICLLRQLPEVDVQRIKALWTSVGARAITEALADKALLLIDGQEYNIEMFGVVFWQALPVHLEDIERIEVIRGPGSALYGANAHSLVVTIETRKSESAVAEAFLGAGEWDRQVLHLRLEQPLGGFRLRLSGGVETSGHQVFASRREREMGRLRLGVDHRSDAGTITVQTDLTVLEGAMLAFFLPGKFKDGLAADVLARFRTDWLRAQLSYAYLRGGMDFDFPLMFGPARMGHFDWYGLTSHTLDALAELTWSPFEGNLLIGGGNFRFIHMHSGQNDPSEVDQLRLGLFVQDRQSIGDYLELTAGVRLDFNSLTPREVSPRGAVVWRFSQNQSLRAGLSRAFRKPSFLNTHFHPTMFVPAGDAFEGLRDWFPEQLGNEKLDNESITTLEAGYTARFFDGRLQVAADVFYNWYRDTVSFYTDMREELGLPDLNNSVVEWRNKGGEVDSVGGSISCTFRLMRHFRLSGNYTFRYSHDTGDEWEWGQRIDTEPAHLFNLGFYYLGETGIRAGLSVFGRSYMEDSMPQGGDIFAGTVRVPNPAHTLVSGFLAYRHEFKGGWAEAGVRAYNLLRAGFYDHMTFDARPESETGGQWLGRQALFYVRGAI